MTAVFVHGVPETPAVWQGLLAALDRPDTGRKWGPEFAAIPAPGLVIIPSEDPFLSAASATRAAARADARTVALDALGHWMLQDPARAATVLREFWATRA
jgi:pimeloyl-ACP methyl ester carboxylesterase